MAKKKKRPHKRRTDQDSSHQTHEPTADASEPRDHHNDDGTPDGLSVDPSEARGADDEHFVQARDIPDTAVKYLVDDDGAAAWYSGELPDEPGDFDDADGLFDEDGEPIDLSRLKPRPSPARLVLMAAVIAFSGWLLHAYYDEIRYYFSDETPVDLGNAMDYVMVTGEDGRITRNKELDLPHNAYVRIQGVPTRQAVAGVEKSRFSFFGSSEPRIIYQLEGAKIFVEESTENSQVQRFNEAAVAGNIDVRSTVELLDLDGRLLAFDQDDEGVYAGIREYYTERYGVRFCSDVPESEVEKARANLGRGGVILVSEDGGRTFIEGGSGTDASLYAVDFLAGDDARTGYAVGSTGTLLTTSDGGLTWSPLPLDERHALFDVDFTGDGRHGLLGGQRGALWRTDDVRAGFTAPYPWLARDVRAVSWLPDGKTAMAVGAEGLLLRSTDQGKTWAPAPIVTQPDFHDTVRTAGGALLASGDGGLLLRSTDDGRTWAPTVTDTSADLRDLTVLPDGRVVAAGDDETILESNDDGMTWTRSDVHIVAGLDLDEDFHAAAFDRTGRRGVFVGDDGSLARTEDGGRTVELRSHAHATGVVAEQILAGRSIPQALATVARSSGLPDLNGVAWSGERVLAVGRDATFLVSEDTGLTWQRRSLPLNGEPDLWDVAFVDDQRGFIAGEDGLVLTTRDGGSTWTRMKLSSTRTVLRLVPVPDNPGVMLFSGRGGLWGYWKADADALYYPESSTTTDITGLVTRQAGPIADTRAMKVLLVGDGATMLAFDNETDTSESLWQATAGDLRAVSAARNRIPAGPDPHAGEDIVLGVGARGLVFRSTDGGQVFAPEHSGTHVDLHAIAVAPDGMTAWAGGDDGVLLVDRGANASWQPLDLGTTDAVRAIGVDRDIPNQILVAAGAAVLRSDDAGASFTEVFRGTEPIHTLVQDAVTGRWWGAGARGTILSSDDGGQRWRSAAIPGGADLNALSVDGDEVTAVGAPGIMARSTDGGTSFELSRTGVDVPLHGLVIRDDGEESWASGANGTLLRSTDRGASWEVATPPAGVDLHGLYAHPDDGRLWLVGDNQTVFLKEAADEPWSPRATVASDLYQVRFVGEDGQTGFAVGDEGLVLKTMDGGATWSTRHSNTSARLRDIAFDAQGQRGVAVGDAGAFITTFTFGEGWTRRSMPFRNDLGGVALVPASAGDADAGEDAPLDVVVTGEDGIAAVSPLQEKLKFELSVSPRTEHLRGQAQLGAAGERLVVVGGQFEDPSTVCERGYILLPESPPSEHLRYLIMAFLIGGFAVFTGINLVRNLLRLARD